MIVMRSLFMRILLVEQFAKTVGRDSMQLAEEMNHLQATSVYLSDDHTLELDRYPVHEVVIGFHNVFSGNPFAKVKKYLRGVKELVEHIEKEKYDAVILQWFCLPWIEWRSVKRMGKSTRVFILLHDLIPFDRKPLQMTYLSKIYNLASGIFVQSKKALAEFPSVYPRVKTPRYFVGCAFGAASNAIFLDKGEARKHLEIPDDAIVYLLYGTVRKTKGLPLLIKAIGKAQKQNEKVFLLVAGTLRDYTEKQIQDFADMYLKPNSYRFDFRYVEDDEEKWFFNASDVICVPYLEVTQSGVQQLAFHYKKPLIVSDSGNLPEGVEEGKNGYVFKTGVEDDLADKIIRLSDPKANLFKMGEISYEIGERDFNLTKKAKAILKAIEKGE